MNDETEMFRRERQAELNRHYSREALEMMHGKVWSTDELRLEFEVQGFFAPLVIVKSLASRELGSLEFQHSPRFYFNLRMDGE